MRRAAGFSLLELVAVLSIFALVALIGVQVMQATLRASERLTGISETTGELALGLALLRQDLDAALPMPFTPANGGTEPALIAAGDGFALTVGGLARLAPGSSGQGRVVWRHDPATGAVLRQVWTTRNPGGGRPAEVAVLSDVRGLSVSSFEVQGGWRAGFAADPRDTARLPLGLKVRIDHARLGGIDTVVSLR